MSPPKEELFQALRRIFDGDQAPIEHAERVLELAEEIGQAEGADPDVIVPAAILHDIGYAGGGEGAALPTPETHGRIGAAMVPEVLEPMDIADAVIQEVADIISHHHDRDAMTGPNARAIWDADLIVNLASLPPEEALAKLRERALTESGRRVGERCLR